MCIAQRARAAAGMAGRRRARAPPSGRAQWRSRAPRQRWFEPRSAASRARFGSREARASTGRAWAPRATLRASRSERYPPPALRAGGELERRRADERSDAAERRGGAGWVGLKRARAPTQHGTGATSDASASRSEREPLPAWRFGGERERRRADGRGDAVERRGGAGSSRDQRRVERGSGRGKYEHRQTQQGRHERHRVYRAASATRRRHGEPVTSDSAAARTGAVTQLSAEAALARAAVSGDHSEGHFEENTSIDERSTRAMSDAVCIAQRSRPATGMASRRRARAPPRGRARRRSRTPRRRWLEQRSAAG